MASKEDLGKFKVGDLQKELETTELDTAGKKTELVGRLWEALQKEKR